MFIVISGAYGFRNLGDEAMLHMVIRCLRDAHLDCQIIVSSVSRADVAGLHGMQSVMGISLGAIARKILAFDLEQLTQQLKVLRGMRVLVFGGGSLLNDAKGNKNIFSILLIVLFANLRRVSVIFWGISIGPLNGRVGTYIIRAILKLSNVVIVRDNYSKELADKLCYGKCTVRKGSDLLLALPITDSSGARTNKAKQESIRVGLSLRPFPPVHGGNFRERDRLLIEEMSKACIRLAADFNVEFIPLVFSEGSGQQNDIRILEGLKERCPQVRFDSLKCGLGRFEGQSIDSAIVAIMHVMSTLDIVIGERFHSLVTAATSGVPFVALAYDKKISELAVACGLSPYCIDVVQSMEKGALSSKVINRFTLLWGSLDEARETLLENVKSMRSTANSDCKFILNFLKLQKAIQKSSE